LHAFLLLRAFLLLHAFIVLHAFLAFASQHFDDPSPLLTYMPENLTGELPRRH